MKQIKQEGYWRQHPDSDEGLPFPIPQTIVNKVWRIEGKHKFLIRLTKVQEKSKIGHYKGWSNCRLCGDKNGSNDFTYNEWRWPIGLEHYIIVHNVRPSLEFRKFIIKNSKVTIVF